jgi:polyferredoxin/tetratricopeptide (TPR) repeat protein
VPSGGDRLHIRKSRSSPKRAAVLIAVAVLMAAHIIQWRLSASHKTIAPIEPSESMYTIELGQINAGFVFFAAALLSTFIFGRFFCGWGCHVVALQDLCGHWMTKLGVKPKPFRSRVLLWGPLLLALYMFVWVTVKRLVVFPLADRIRWTPPSWLLTRPGVLPAYGAHFVVTDFWRTFPPWYVAIPFLFVCGFAAVYFLGSKGFCTYACPYGGFFAPIDKISVGRIVVNDRCEGCGHCTAVCTSNVRVHQEVRDFGMVIDPGCMKCLDCVSVCPNEALSFSFAAPAVLTKPRTPEAAAGHTQRPEYDLSLGHDVLLLGVTILLFVAFRGMFDSVPLLMAAGMAAVGAFAAWKFCALVTQPNVRLQNRQLKHKGTIRLSGMAFGLAAAAYLLLGAWGLAVDTCEFIGAMYDERVTVPYEAVFSAGYKPLESDKHNALDAIDWIERSAAPSEHGFGWSSATKSIRCAWLYAVSGDLPGAEIRLRQIVLKPGHEIGTPVLDNLSRVMFLQGKPPSEVREVFEQVLALHPDFHPVRVGLMGLAFQEHRPQRAAELAEQIVASRVEADGPTLARAGEALMAAGKLDRAFEVLSSLAQKHPKSAALHAELARVLWLKDQRTQAIDQLSEASRLEPKNPAHLHGLAELLGLMGRQIEAQAAEQEATKIEQATEMKKPRE